MYIVNTKFDGPYSIKSTVEPTNYSQVVGKTYYVCEQSYIKDSAQESVKKALKKQKRYKYNKEQTI